MFTGLIEETGKLLHIHKKSSIIQITIAADLVLKESKVGDSIAANGVCLTISELSKQSFSAQLMPETIAKTNFANYKNNTILNLERALQANARLGGHIVTGHIDTTGIVDRITQQGNSHILQIKLLSSAHGLIVNKGSIAIDGVSLTVITGSAMHVSVGIIPHTFKNTILHQLKVGQKVNIEFDIQGKYAQAQHQQTLSFNQLNQWGYQ